MSVPTLNMCDLHYSGASVYREAPISDNNADIVLRLIHDTLLDAGWTETNVIPDEWFLILTSIPTQNPHSPLLTWSWPSSPTIGTEIDPAGYVYSLYWFDPSRYVRPTISSPFIILVDIGTTTFQTLDNLGNGIAAGTGAGYDTHHVDSSGNYFLRFFDVLGGSFFNSNGHAGQIWAGRAPAWGYHGQYSFSTPLGAGNVHYVNGGAELRSQAANGKTQFWVHLLRGGPVYGSVATSPFGGPDYSGGLTANSPYSVFPGDRSSGGQFEYNIAVVKFIDQYGGTVTYELWPGWSTGSGVYPKANKYKIIANPYQFFLWAEGYALGPFGSGAAVLFATAPYVDNPAINYLVITHCGWMFDASQYPSPPNYPFIHFEVPCARQSPSWVNGFAVALNDGFKVLPASMGQVGYTDAYRACGIVGLGLAGGYPVYSMNGSVIASTPYLLAPPDDPTATGSEAVIVGIPWDMAYLSKHYGTMYGNGSPNDAAGSMPDSTYEQDSTFMGHNWKMVETSVSAVAVGGRRPEQSLWMTWDS
jgi:hypothetical protein